MMIETSGPGQELIASCAAPFGALSIGVPMASFRPCCQRTHAIAWFAMKAGTPAAVNIYQYRGG
jgi:hypothetical protein